MLDDVEENRTASAYLWGWKRRTYEAAILNAEALYASQFAETPLALKTLVYTLPGIGVVKAAFVLQLAGHDVACLDSRNNAREGRRPREFRTDGRRVSWCMIERYLSETAGKAEAYWDAWCIDVASARNRDPEDISALHLSILPENHIPF
jgi:hypothetical protein